MKYVAAALTSLCLIAEMFSFRSAMLPQMREWEEEDISLTKVDQLMVTAANVIAIHWFLLAVLIFSVCFGVASLFPDDKSDNSATGRRKSDVE